MYRLILRCLLMKTALLLLSILCLTACQSLPKTSATGKTVEQEQPNTPEVLDSDGDGVTDDLDICPDTPAQALRVDSQGCAIDNSCEGTSLIDSAILRFFYQTNQRNPFIYNTSLFDENTTMTQQLKDRCTLVEGHTSQFEDDEVAKDRAVIIAQILTERYGFDAKKIHIKHYGHTRPMADPNLPEGSQYNQRVFVTWFRCP